MTDPARPENLVNIERIHQVLLANLSKSSNDKILPRFIGDTFEAVARRSVAYTAGDLWKP